MTSSSFPDPDASRIPVTLTLPPPPSSSFRVTGISGLVAPVTTAGSKPITAQVAGAPSGAAVQVQWRFVWSIGADGTPYDTLTTSWIGATTTVFVHSGSYHLSIRATPRANGTNGLAFTGDYPVCTSEPLRNSGKPGQQRPQGC